MQDVETVVWTPVTTSKDAYGNVTSTPGTPVRLEALVAARLSTENQSPNAAGVVTGKYLYIPGMTDEPGPADTFLVRGKTYQVIGESHSWGTSGVQVAIQRTDAAS